MITYRSYNDADGPVLLDLFRDTIKRVNSRDYSPTEIAAWASSEIDAQEWTKRFDGRFVRVAVLNSDIIGFADISPEGHLDRLFVSADYQGQGIASRLLQQLLQHAAATKIANVFTEASMTARPFFESRGFKVLEQQRVKCRGVLLTNFRMTRVVQPHDGHPVEDQAGSCRQVARVHDDGRP